MLRSIFDGWHIVILAILIIAIFGWKRLPDAARSLGRSARILKSEMDDMKKDGKSDASGQTVPGQTTSQSPQQPYAQQPQQPYAQQPQQPYAQQPQQPNPYPQHPEGAPQAQPQQHTDGTTPGA
ncbi:Sec-independent protein translocase subunit TatA [Leekyejoonella antrihumi]|uniref:Sec-independent protein translocase protein TatA n=1 Tax=Leekyejoonella antrihumi TaxID=1660198 RepID=A0A563E3T1_9MICO|nr:Sec-independent protein translocase subunit TatA [Leekyejoonella antrihumi]TWP36861.1 Sec-independent protein translocase subunit TatA [Leekyejoonella antrihumi]